MLNKLFKFEPDANAVSVIIYSDKISPRLDYVCEFIFNHVLNVNYKISNDLNEFTSSKDFKINYSDKQLPDVFTIIPSGILSETGIKETKPKSELKNNLIYFYCNSEKDLFHFDIFSAVFYFISRYEEWQKFTPDAHGRFELKESILYNSDTNRGNFHLKPVVELWVEELKNELLKKNPSISFPSRKFKSIATIDVDNLYAYKHKGFLRTAGAGLKDLLKFDWANIMRRNRVMNDIDKDPFDIYDDFSVYCKEKQIPLYFFFLLKTGTKYDRTVNPKSIVFKNIFEILKKNSAEIGLHPSYFSSLNQSTLDAEVNLITQKLSEQVSFSRQHYLKFNIKTTPTMLIKNNILADFSMGFASGAGLRAGTTIPFYYYDFNTESKKNLLFVPFCAMDGAYFVYNNLSADEAYKSLNSIKSEIKKANGLFITVFHERTFAQHLYPGFGEMYKKLLID